MFTNKTFPFNNLDELFDACEYTESPGVASAEFVPKKGDVLGFTFAKEEGENGPFNLLLLSDVGETVKVAPCPFAGVLGVEDIRVETETFRGIIRYSARTTLPAAALEGAFKLGEVAPHYFSSDETLDEGERELRRIRECSIAYREAIARDDRLLDLIAARVEKNNVIAFPKSYHPRDYEKKGAASASSLVWKDDFVRGERDDLPKVEVSLEYLDEARLVRLYWRISEDVKPRRYLWSFFKASEDASSNVLEAVHDTTFEVSRKDGGCKVLSFASLGGDPSKLELRCIVEPITYDGEVDIFDQKRDYKIARQAYEKVLETRREILGKTHPDTLTTMQELARLHQEEGASEAARAMYEEVLAAKREVLGEDHPDILATKQHLTNLADD